jgi:predicted DCC family thiol-disulfide oxidoreductase YuxK
MRWLVDRDRNRRLLFAPLQGETARAVLARHADVDADDSVSTVVYVRDFGGSSERVYLRSDAALAILRDVGRGYQVLSAFRALPRGLRDLVYDWIASHRYRWFGKLDACRLPGPGEGQRFLP